MGLIRSERFRQKLLALSDGHFADLQYTLFHLNELVEGEAVADWLLFRGLKGQKLHEWTQENWNGLFLPMFDYIRAQVNRQNVGKPVLIGRDYGRSI